MKILFNITSMRKGGAERVISILTNELSKRDGVEVNLIIDSSVGIAYKLNENIKIHELEKEYIKNPLIRNIKRTINTKKILKKENPDIIIAFLPIPSFRVLLLKKKNKIPVIIADRNDPNEEYKDIISKCLMKFLYKRADGFVFQTKDQREFFDNRIKEKSKIIYNPINEEFIGLNKKAGENHTIISVGRLMEQKNHKMLISAFSNVVKKHPQYTLNIFGSGSLKEQLENQIKDLNLKDKVFLKGISNNIKDELLKSDLFILSSDYEGMPNVLLEAMACGLPVISTDCPCGGPKEIVENRKNGILVKVRDQIELENAMIELIENSDMREMLGENAKAVSEKLTKEKIVSQWEAYISETYAKAKKGV